RAREARRVRRHRAARLRDEARLRRAVVVLARRHDADVDAFRLREARHERIGEAREALREARLLVGHAARAVDHEEDVDIGAGLARAGRGRGLFRIEIAAAAGGAVAASWRTAAVAVAVERIAAARATRESERAHERDRGRTKTHGRP